MSSLKIINFLLKFKLKFSSTTKSCCHFKMTTQSKLSNRKTIQKPLEITYRILLLKKNLPNSKKLKMKTMFKNQLTALFPSSKVTKRTANIRSIIKTTLLITKISYAKQSKVKTLANQIKMNRKTILT